MGTVRTNVYRDQNAVLSRGDPGVALRDVVGAVADAIVANSWVPCNAWFTIVPAEDGGLDVTAQVESLGLVSWDRGSSK